MTSIYAIAADGLLVIHFLFIVFALFGGFLLLRWGAMAFLHIPALLWGIWIELSGAICPLTPIENTLRGKAGEMGYEGSFIEHYLIPVIYPAGLTRDQQFVLAAILIAVNLVAYGLWVRQRYSSTNKNET